MKKVNLNVIVGLGLLVVGLLIGIQTLFSNIAVDYWVILWSFIALVGVVMSINERRIGIMSSILMVVGIWNLLRHYELITTSVFALIWPIIIIVIGINLMIGKKIFNNVPVTVNGENMLEYNGIFGGVEEKVTMKKFLGLNATAIFGSVNLDLRDIEIEENVQINISTLFGGVSLILPDQYNVVMGDSLSIFGGTENKFKGSYHEDRKSIYINSKAIFGGTELR